MNNDPCILQAIDDIALCISVALRYLNEAEQVELTNQDEMMNRLLVITTNLKHLIASISHKKTEKDTTVSEDYTTQEMDQENGL